MDEDLARQARSGSTEAFAALVRRNQSLIRGFLRRLSGNAALADDLAQETFVLAWRKIGSWDGRGSFKGWLCRIAYTQFLQDRRASQRQLVRETQAYELTDQVTSSQEGSEAKLDLDRLLAQLKPEVRAVLAMSFGADMSHQEIADALHLPLGTVKSHIQRGRASLLEAMNKQEQTHVQ